MRRGLQRSGRAAMMRRMAMTERRYVFEAVETLSDALIPFVEGRLRYAYDGRWQAAAAERIRALNLDPQGNPVWDLSTLLRAIDLFWMETFSFRLGRAERSIAHELIDIRNRLAHNAPFTWDDTERALDSARRLMAAIGAGDSARRIGNMREAVLRSKYVEHPPGAAYAPAPRSAPPPPGASETPRKFTRDMFDAELNRMLDEARAAGADTCTVVSRELHRRVVGGSQPNRMPQACDAMWKLWELQGSDPDRIVHTTPSRRSSTIEIEYRL